MLQSFQPAMSRMWAFAVLSFSLVFSSIPVVQKYAGFPGVLAYVMVVICTVVLWGRPRVGATFSRMSLPVSVLVVASVLLAMWVLFLIIYPLANSDQIGQGSDRDDALNMAVRALLRGEHPYREMTYLGNPVTPMPGALLLATPFVFLGNSAYQNLFWLAAFVGSAGAVVRTPGYTPWMFSLLLLLSPALWQDFLTGGDLLANSLYVFVCALWMIRTAICAEAATLTRVTAATLLGLGLASRPHFVLIVPLVFAVMARHLGTRVALKYLSVTMLVTTVLVLPLYLFDPAAFSPLHVANKLRKFGGALPRAEYWLPAISALAACVVARGASAHDFMHRAAVVLLLPVIGATVLDSLESGKVSFDLAAHGLNFMMFAVVASTAALFVRADPATNKSTA